FILRRIVIGTTSLFGVAIHSQKIRLIQIRKLPVPICRIEGFFVKRRPTFSKLSQPIGFVFLIVLHSSFEARRMRREVQVESLVRNGQVIPVSVTCRSEVSGDY